MKLQDQVSSLELSKKLKELGVMQCNIWYWQKQKSWFIHQHKPDRDENYSAFTVAELGEMLPEAIRIKKQFRMLTLLKRETTNEKTRQTEMVYGYYYFDCVDGEGCKDQTPEIPEYDINEADARAKMLIHLIENKLVDVKTLTN